MIISHEHQEYRRRWAAINKNKYNGAYYYSQEILKNIIPNVVTDRNWMTVNLQGTGAEHSIVFVHNNLHPEHYEWLKGYKDIVLVCGVPETVEKVSHIGKAIYLPLSVDTEYLKQFKTEEKSGTAFIGRPAKRKMDGVKLPKGIDIIEGIERSKMLKMMAKYENVYAVGRTAIEAKALGCNVLAYDPRYPNPDRWEVIDNHDAAKMLQTKLDEIDGKGKEYKPTIAWKKADIIKWAEDNNIKVNPRDSKKKLLEQIDG